jgi:hypothetical protein
LKPKAAGCCRLARDGIIEGKTAGPGLSELATRRPGILPAATGYLSHGAATENTYLSLLNI